MQLLPGLSSSGFTPINVDSEGHRLPSPTLETEFGHPHKRQKASKPNPWTPRKPKRVGSQRILTKATGTSKNRAFNEHQANDTGDKSGTRDKCPSESEHSPSETTMSKLRAFLYQPDIVEAREHVIRAKEPAIKMEISRHEDTAQAQPKRYRSLRQDLEDSHENISAGQESISAEQWSDHDAATNAENLACPGTPAKLLVPATQDETITETPTTTPAALHIVSPETETDMEPWLEAMDLDWECVDQLIALERTDFDDQALADGGMVAGEELDRSGRVDKTHNAQINDDVALGMSPVGPIQWPESPCPREYHEVAVPQSSPCPFSDILRVGAATGNDCQDESFFDELDDQAVFDMIDASARVSAATEQRSSPHTAAVAERPRLYFNAPREFKVSRKESQSRSALMRVEITGQPDLVSSSRVPSPPRKGTTKQSSSSGVATSPLKVKSSEPVALDTPSSSSSACKPPTLAPFVRGVFPQPVADQSAIPGLSSSLALRVCFRIGELLGCARSVAYQNRSILVELYAKINKRQDGLGELHLVLGDLFYPQRPPYLDAVWRGWQSNEYWVTDAEHLTIGAICRVLGKVEKEMLGGKCILNISSAQQVCWADVDHVKGIVCAK